MSRILIGDNLSKCRSVLATVSNNCELEFLAENVKNIDKARQLIKLYDDCNDVLKALTDD